MTQMPQMKHHVMVIEIAVGNSPCGETLEERDAEISRILTRLANRFSAASQTPEFVFDSKGNAVGHIKFIQR